jgi:signal transduction histidine kinase
MPLVVLWSKRLKQARASLARRFCSLLLLCATSPAFALLLGGGSDSPADSLRQAFATASNDTLRVRALNALARHFSRRETNYDSAVRYAEEAIRLAENAGYARGKAIALRYLGNVRRYQNRLDEALRLYLESLSLLESLGDRLLLSEAYNLVGEVFRYQNIAETAMHYYRKALAVAESANNPTAIALALNNAALVLKNQGEYTQALEYLHRSLVYEDDKKNTRSYAYTLTNLGALHNLRYQHDSALIYAERALALIHKEETKVRISALIVLANAYHGLRRFEKAAVHAERAIILADSIEFRVAKDEGSKADALLVLSAALDSLGRTKEAFAAFRLYAAFRDSLQSEETAANIERLVARYETARKDKEIKALEQEKNRQILERNLSLAALALTVAIALALVRLYRQKERASAEILRQQQVLEDQAAEIELANTALHEKNNALERLNTEKNEFLGIAAHDMKNPLAAIMVNVGFVQRYFDRMTKTEILKTLENIEATAQRMSGIVSNLLDINAIESGAIEYSFHDFDLAPVLQRLVGEYEERALAKGIALKTEIAPTALVVHADLSATIQVLDNLLSNAVKYSALNAPVTVRALRLESVVRIEIHNFGEGIAPEDMPRLFGKFARLSARPTAGEDSTGLGLSIVKKMTEAMQGRVWCESAPHEGATFFVELPAAGE